MTRVVVADNVFLQLFSPVHTLSHQSGLTKVEKHRSTVSNTHIHTHTLDDPRTQMYRHELHSDVGRAASWKRLSFAGAWASKCQDRNTLIAIFDTYCAQNTVRKTEITQRIFG